jgi:hypothetical protein
MLPRFFWPTFPSHRKKRKNEFEKKERVFHTPPRGVSYLSLIFFLFSSYLAKNLPLISTTSSRVLARSCQNQFWPCRFAARSCRAKTGSCQIDLWISWITFWEFFGGKTLFGG